MADESKEPLPVPLGAQVMRKMHAAMKALHGECSKAVGALDESDAKNAINEHMGAMETNFSGMAKAFGKLYKDLDLEEEEKKPDEKEPDADPDDKEKEPERQIVEKDDDPKDDDEDDGMSRTEKSLLLSKIRQLESKVRHEERLQRMRRIRPVR